jgi:hypothetical protein
MRTDCVELFLLRSLLVFSTGRPNVNMAGNVLCELAILSDKAALDYVMLAAEP